MRDASGAVASAASRKSKTLIPVQDSRRDGYSEFRVYVISGSSGAIPAVLVFVLVELRILFLAVEAFSAVRALIDIGRAIRAEAAPGPGRCFPWLSERRRRRQEPVCSIRN